MKRLLLSSSLVLACAAAALAAGRIYGIRIDFDGVDDCKYHSWIGINFSVRTDQDNIRWREHAACGYTLRRRVTQGNVECMVDSGMCGSFGRRGEVEVECSAEGGYRYRETASFNCP